MWIDLGSDVWATPRTMPPTRVPQSEPMPPMTTASKAKISWVGPDEGEKLDRIPKNVPAMVTVPTAMAVASA